MESYSKKSAFSWTCDARKSYNIESYRREFKTYGSGKIESHTSGLFVTNEKWALPLDKTTNFGILFTAKRNKIWNPRHQ